LKACQGHTFPYGGWFVEDDYVRLDLDYFSAVRSIFSCGAAALVLDGCVRLDLDCLVYLHTVS
jgi:hypothetical protein